MVRIMKKPLLVIVGPTASGKTALSIELAKKYNGEIISADSMQIYKGMDIATAKPTVEEMQGIPHHLMSIIDIDKPFSVADFVMLAKEKIEEIYSRGRLPIVVGGTGLYINSLIDNIKFDDTSSDEQIRERLLNKAKKEGNKALLDKLYEVDPETASQLHENNLTRIIRALEVYELTGEKLSVHKKNSRLEESPYDTCIIGLNYEDRQKLYDRINLRVDEMVKSGLVDEAREVYLNKNLKTACQAIGYKELIPYFNGTSSLEACLDILKQQTRRYAKRQLTWFRRDERINWIYIDQNDYSKEKIFNKVVEIIEKSQIL